MPAQPSLAALNVIGAAALLVADDIIQAVEAETGLAAISAAALVSIAHAPGAPIDYLAKSLRRSHSAVVRLVATLVDQGYAEKHAAQDGRAVSLALTRAGRQVVKKALARRQETLQRLFASLPSAQIDALEKAARTLIDTQVTDELGAMWICRLCDGEACDPCPMAVLEDEPVG